MSDSFARPRAILAGLARRGRGRVLAPRAGIDFASNDYLGLAAGLELRAAAAEALTRGVPVGSGGSRLLRGNHPEHELLEAEAAAFFGAEAALFLPTGFAANVALLATLPQRGDKVFADELAHASMHEGLALARASHGFFAHNDAAACAAAIAAWRAEGGTGTTWIAIESLYSMDGDTADIAAFGAVAAAHDAVLIVDEAQHLSSAALDQLRHFHDLGRIGLAVFMFVWGLVGISGIDHFLRPYLISREARLPFALVFLGALGGVLAFGFIGIFLGPTLLAVGYALLHEFLIPKSRNGDSALT